LTVLPPAAAPLARDGHFFDRVAWSGSHAASLRMVRDGDADIAAIDCVTYGYIKEEDPASLEGIAVLGYSASVPGLPLVAGRAVPAELLARLRAGLTAPGAEVAGHMHELHILAFEHRADADYRRIIQLEAEACASGYPLLA
jgi:ABC-type phosphate/phosphonate transport system substrate-binding protein